MWWWLWLACTGSWPRNSLSCDGIEGATTGTVDSFVWGDVAIVPCRRLVWSQPVLLPSRSQGESGALAVGSSTTFHFADGVGVTDGPWPQDAYSNGDVYEERAVLYLRHLEPEEGKIEVLERMVGLDVEVPTMVDWDRPPPDASVHVTDQRADMDNDGIEDLLIQGAPDFQTSWLPGTESGLSPVPPAEALGFRAMSLGDVTGDGVADIGRFDTVPDGAVNDDGEALVLSVQPLPVAGSLGDAPWEIQLGTDLHDADHWGHVSGWAGDALVQGGFDHNGDGVADVVVGAEMPDETAGERGSVVVFDGPVLESRRGEDADGWLSRSGADCTLEAESWNCDSVGSSVKSAGDVDGDGYPDLLVASAESWANGVYRSGSLYLVPGPLAAEMDLDEVAVARLDGGYEGAHFPDYMQGRGDLDGDGRSDVIVAQATGRQEHGMVVHHGPVEGVKSWQEGTWICDQFGASGSVAFDADVDGDGVHDLVYNAAPTQSLHIWYSTISMEYPRPDSDCFL